MSTFPEGNPAGSRARLRARPPRRAAVRPAPALRPEGPVVARGEPRPGENDGGHRRTGDSMAMFHREKHICIILLLWENGGFYGVLWGFMVVLWD